MAGVPFVLDHQQIANALMTYPPNLTLAQASALSIQDLIRLFQLNYPDGLIVINSGGGGVNFIGIEDPAVKVSQIFNGTAGLGVIDPGISITQSDILLVSETVGGKQVSQLVSGTGVSLVNEASTVRSILTLTPQDAPAGKVTFKLFTLNGIYVPGSPVNSGTPGWTNPANAGGGNDNVFATIAGSATVVQGGTLSFTFPTLTNKSLLVISSVIMYSFYKSAGNSIATNPVFQGFYTLVGGAETLLFSAPPTTASNNTGGTANQVDLTSIVAGDWTKLSGMTARVTASLPATVNAGVTLSFDAMELHIVASLTEAQ